MPSTRTFRIRATATAIAIVAPAALLALVLSLSVKGAQIAILDPQGSLLLGTLLAWAPDLSFWCLATALALPLLEAPWRAVRWPAIALFAALAALYVALTTATHGYFSATGANLSWSAIDFFLAHRDDVSQVIASEGSALWFFAAFSRAAAALGLVLLPLLPPVRARLERIGSLSPRASLLAIGGLLLLAGPSALCPSPRGAAATSAHSVPYGIVKDLVLDRLLPRQRVELGELERNERSLRFDARPDGPRPNVIIVFFESLRWNESDAYNPGLDTTPFLAELAQEGVLIDRQYAVLPHTTKSVVSMNCGLYPYLDTTPKESMLGILPERCIAHVLGEQGYRTAFFNPVWDFENRPRLIANMGYDTYHGLDDLPIEGFEPTNYFGYEEKTMTRPILDWIEEVRQDGPFLLNILTLSSHHNYVTPQSWPSIDFPVADRDHHNYRNALRYTDEWLRELWGELEARGVLEDSFVIIVGDHGEAFGEHGRRQHDLIMWEEGLRSFGLLWGPRYLEGLYPAGSTVQGDRSHLDLQATVFDLLDLELVEGSLLGSSLLEPVDPDRTLYASCWFERRCMAVRQRGVKTIYHYGLRPTEVYDTHADPLEQTDLAGSDAQPDERIEQREEELLQWARGVNQQYEDWAARRTAGAVTGKPPGVSRPLPARFGDMIELVGVDIEREALEAGQGVDIAVSFGVLKTPSSSTRLAFQIVHPDGTVNIDHTPVHGTLPVKRWRPGSYVRDELHLHLPATWSTGDAYVLMGFFDTRTNRCAPVSATSAPHDGQWIEIARLRVEGHEPPPPLTAAERRERALSAISTSAPDLPVGADALFGDRIRLVGVARERMEVHRGGTVEARTAFAVEGEVPPGWELVTQLVRDDGFELDTEHQPLGGLYPPEDWQVGEYVTDKLRIYVRKYRAKPGSYRLLLGFEQQGAPVPVRSDGALPADERHRIEIGRVTVLETTDG